MDRDAFTLWLYSDVFDEETEPMSDLTFDDRSERNLKTLLPGAERLMRKFLRAVLDAGIDAKIISGTRTYAEQAALYAKGRTAPGPKVTNAPPGHSWHNFGLACDLGIWNGADYLEESALYDKAGHIAESLGLEWGGRWKFTDKPHVQVKTGLTLAQCRERVAKGIPLLPDSADEWSLYLNGKLLGELTEKEHTLYYPARALLNRLYGESVVLRSLALDAHNDVLLWNRENTRVPVIYNEQGSALAQIGPLADWLALTAAWDDANRTVKLSRA